MAQILKEHFKDYQGKEAGLPVAARIFLVSGVAASLSGIVVTILTASFLWLGIGIVCLVLGIVFYLLFDALGEIIILLKRLAGLPAKGVISGMKEGTVSVCSECDSLVYPDSVKCTSCGVDFETAALPKDDNAEGK